MFIFVNLKSRFLSLLVQKTKLPLQSIDDLSRSSEYYPITGYGNVFHSLVEVRMHLSVLLVLGVLSFRVRLYLSLTRPQTATAGILSLGTESWEFFCSFTEPLISICLRQTRVQSPNRENKKSSLFCQTFLVPYFYFKFNFYCRGFQSSTSGVYSRLWERIKSNSEESLCRDVFEICLQRFIDNDHLVYIGKQYMYVLKLVAY